MKVDRVGQTGANGAQPANTLLGVLGTHWLFFQAPASAHEIGERLELSREEVGSLSRLKMGEAVLVLPDQQHLSLRVLVPPPWMPAFETDMASMRRNLAEAMEAAIVVLFRKGIDSKGGSCGVSFPLGQSPLMRYRGECPSPSNTAYTNSICTSWPGRRSCAM